jgi:hypothetical protein
LTRDQIDLYNPPPNPAKRKDPRSAWFIAKNWTSSWEVDALKPEVLNKILTDSIMNLIDFNKYKTLLKMEENDKKKLSELKTKI